MLVKQVRQEGDGLDGLSQAHLISEDNAVAPEKGFQTSSMAQFRQQNQQGVCDVLTCTRSEPTSSSHLIGSLSTAGCHLLWMKAVSSVQQTSASASTPTITETILASTITINTACKKGANNIWPIPCSYLAVFRGDSFTRISVYEAVYTVLELLFD